MAAAANENVFETNYMEDLATIERDYAIELQKQARAKQINREKLTALQDIIDRDRFIDGVFRDIQNQCILDQITLYHVVAPLIAQRRQAAVQLNQAINELG